MTQKQYDEPNTLYYGDNLDILKRYVDDESVDLVYLDPPFNSAQSYNVLFASKDGSESAAQIRVFEDTWHWDESAANAYFQTVEAGGRVSDIMQAFRKFLGDNDMLAYLSMMAPRLIELRRTLKASGSLFLHCDPTASHYLKLLLDAVFGPQSYRNEIVWRRYGAHNDVGQGSRHFGRVHDIILWYAPATPKWHQLFMPLKADYVQAMYRHVDPKTGKRFRTTPLTGPGGAAKGNPVYEWKGHTRAWRYSKETMQKLDDEGQLYYSRTGYAAKRLFLDKSKGTPVQDLWDDIPALTGSNDERLGYPTQKPVALLERIIAATTDVGDVVLDPFCGCGTTIAAAQKLNRKWIGIDITHLAINLIRTRLLDTYGTSAKFAVIGEPTTIEDAEELAQTDQYQFQWWALGLVGARPVEQKKGADKGIDGRLYFHERDGSQTRQAIISVKAGKVQRQHVHELGGVITREKADLGVLISFETPTRQMREEAASAGFYESPWGKHPKIQLLTVGELLEGKTVDMPRTAGTNRTFKNAPKAKGKKEAHPELFTDE